MFSVSSTEFTTEFVWYGEVVISKPSKLPVFCYGHLCIYVHVSYKTSPTEKRKPNTGSNKIGSAGVATRRWLRHAHAADDLGPGRRVPTAGAGSTSEAAAYPTGLPAKMRRERKARPEAMVLSLPQLFVRLRDGNLYKALLSTSPRRLSL